MVNESDPLQLSFGLTLMQIIDVVRDSLCFIFWVVHQAVGGWKISSTPTTPKNGTALFYQQVTRGRQHQRGIEGEKMRESASPASCDYDKGGFVFILNGSLD